MGVTVFAQDMGLFHKGSGGKGIGPGDVCLSPPPPPVGPVPIPYVNVAKAGDLSKGSKTVLVDGEPTALEDQSYMSTSSGDEAGTQGGSVITAKTKGKAYFSDWSSTVLIEGMGVCRHGDMMGHNCASKPPACVNAGVYADFCNNKLKKGDYAKPCKKRFSGKAHRPREQTPEQKAHVAEGPCWQCGKTKTELEKQSKKEGKKWRRVFHADHQPPLKIAWEVGGCHMKKSPDAFKDWAKKKQTVAPHCPWCSGAQGRAVKKLNRETMVDDMGSPTARLGAPRRQLDAQLHTQRNVDKVKDLLAQRKQVH